MFYLLVDQTSRHDCHLGAVQCLDLLEDTGTGIIAAVLGEEDWNRGVGEHLDQDIVLGCLETRFRATPIALC